MDDLMEKIFEKFREKYGHDAKLEDGETQVFELQDCIVILSNKNKELSVNVIGDKPIKCNFASGLFVKQSGVSDDVCEWKSDYGFVSDKYKRETWCGHTFYDLHHAVPFKYCPYCGKEIKVVE